MENPIIETFTIPITEWKTVDAGKNTIRIKGVALKGDVVSRNERLYVAKELKKATNTFIGKPVNIHHNNPANEATNIGNITWMDWDDTAELLTYEAEITKAPYVGLLRSKSTTIRGVSIQAKYLHNLCPDCKSKFYTEESFREHMWGNHFKKVSAVPHGIIGEAITLVLSPEVPGYDGTTVDLAETARVQTLRLLETVIKTEKEKENYMSKLNAGVTPRKEIAVGAVAEIKQSEPKQNEAVTPTQTPKETSVVNVEPAKLAVQEAKPEPESAAPKLTEIIVAPANTLTLKESKLIGINEIITAKLSLGEPFAEYKDFAACVAANQDKDNPEAYCGKIKHETEETLALRLNVKQLTQKLNEVIQEQNKPVVVSLPEVKVPADNLTWKDIKPFDSAPLEAKLAEVEAKIPQPYNDQPLKEALATSKYDDSPLKTEVTQIKEQLAELPKIKESVANQKKDFDNLLEASDKSVKEYFAQIKKDSEADKQKIKELEAKITEYEANKLKETAKLETRVDNIEDKLKPGFKGVNKGTGASNKPVLEDPMKPKEKS